MLRLNKGGIFIKLLWLILALIPGPFLFHFFETTESIRGEEASFMLVNTLLLFLVIIVGILSLSVKPLYFFVANAVMIIISVILGTGFITPPNPSWFNPFRMETVIVLTGIVLVVGQLIVRVISSFIYQLVTNRYS